MALVVAGLLRIGEATAPKPEDSDSQKIRAAFGPAMVAGLKKNFSFSLDGSHEKTCIVTERLIYGIREKEKPRRCGPWPHQIRKESPRRPQKRQTGRKAEEKMNVKFKRGDVHPNDPALFYWDTWRGQQRWVNASTLKHRRAMQAVYVEKWQAADLQRHRYHQRLFRLRHGKKRNAKFRAYRNEWKKQRRKTDPCYALTSRCARRLKLALDKKKFLKNGRTLDFLGCSIPELRAHLESKFQPGMNWNNAGIQGWHIDHIIPVSSAKTKAQVIRLFHYTNLQPLWWKDNLSKGSKLPC